MGLRTTDSCRKPYKHLGIHPLQTQYILSLMTFVAENRSLFHVNSEMHGIITRQKSYLYQPQANLTLCQKGVRYSGVKVYNNLPPNIRNLFSDVKNFKLELGKYLHLKSFYTLDEYYDSCKS